MNREVAGKALKYILSRPKLDVAPIFEAIEKHPLNALTTYVNCGIESMRKGSSDGFAHGFIAGTIMGLIHEDARFIASLESMLDEEKCKQKLVQHDRAQKDLARIIKQAGGSNERFQEG